MPAGRPTKLTSEVADKICQALKAGNWREVAAQWAGIGERTFREWMAKGEDDPDGIHGDFRRRVLEAEQQAEIRMVALVMKAAENDPRHAEWWLERKNPGRWGRQVHEVQGKDGGPVAVEITVVENASHGALTTLPETG